VASLPLSSAKDLPVALFVPQWERLDWLWHGFSTRQGGVSTAYGNETNSDSNLDSYLDFRGDLNLGFRPEDQIERVLENRRLFIRSLTGDPETPLKTVRQVHSDRSLVTDELDPQCEGDGLITATPGILVGIVTADCIPVLVVDPVRRVVAAFHAGWRGTVSRIVEQGIARMEQEFQSDPATLLGAIGPGIGQCCYTVGGEVRQRFEADFEYGDQLFSEADGLKDGEWRLNLTEANRRQLLAAGLSLGSIATVGGCTSCQPDRFFSHRASGGRTGRMMAAIGIRQEGTSVDASIEAGRLEGEL
jgi:YfiH family protein